MCVCFMHPYESIFAVCVCVFVCVCIEWAPRDLFVSLFIGLCICVSLDIKSNCGSCALDDSSSHTHKVSPNNRHPHIELRGEVETFMTGTRMVNVKNWERLIIISIFIMSSHHICILPGVGSFSPVSVCFSPTLCAHMYRKLINMNPT